MPQEIEDVQALDESDDEAMEYDSDNGDVILNYYIYYNNIISSWSHEENNDSKIENDTLGRTG